MDEFDWIARYLKPIAPSPEAMGLSNDVGKLLSHSGSVRIATMDTLAAGTHFLKTDPLDLVGRKLVRVNVSDIISKGGLPEQVMLSIALPDGFSEQEFETLCRGIGGELQQRGISLIGGDTIRFSGPLTLTMMMTGRCEQKGPTTRSGAKAGDEVFVTGKVGAGYLGLQAARSGNTGVYLDHYRCPEITDERWAGLISEFATSSLDISDGLLADASHLADESRQTFSIDLDQVPWAAEPRDLEEMLAFSTGGDDYQALFTVPADRFEKFETLASERGLFFQQVGAVSEGSGVKIHRSGVAIPLPSVKGYTH